MQHSFEEVREFAQELPEDQRLMLVNSLLETLDEQDSASEAEIAAAWDQEIAHRVAEIKAGTAATCSIDDVAADLRSILGK